MKLNLGPFLALPMLASGLPVAATAPDMQAQARAKVAEFLVWEREVKPSGLYQGDLGGALPNIVSPELLCLLNAASRAREIATREAPDEKPPFVEGNPFLPNAWDHLLGSQILSSRTIAGSRDRSEVKVRFIFGEPGTPLDAGGSCNFCQSGSLRATIFETLTAYPAAGGEQCKGLAEMANKPENIN